MAMPQSMAEVKSGGFWIALRSRDLGRTSGGMRASVWATDRNGMQSSNKVGPRNRRSTSRETLQMLTASSPKNSQRSQRKNGHGFSRIHMDRTFLLPIRVDLRESGREVGFVSCEPASSCGHRMFPVYSSVTEER